MNEGLILKKAMFFDRDDTLIKDTSYMHKLEDLLFFDDTFEVLKNLQAKGYLLFIVTNQSGIGRGFYTENDMHKFNEQMLEKLSEQGITITELVFCPHSPEQDCDCRKPHPRLLNQLCEKHDIDRKNSFMVGDKESDIQAGENAGLKTFLVNKPNNNLKELIQQRSI
jgi:D-glycero-D-manno-heptose 1,7-bisphosphate phosphatase